MNRPSHNRIRPQAEFVGAVVHCVLPSFPGTYKIIRVDPDRNGALIESEVGQANWTNCRTLRFINR